MAFSECIKFTTYFFSFFFQISGFFQYLNVVQSSSILDMFQAKRKQFTYLYWSFQLTIKAWLLPNLSSTTNYFFWNFKIFFSVVKSGSIVDFFQAKNPWILMTILNSCSISVDNKGVIFDKYVTNLTSTTNYCFEISRYFSV